MFERTWSADWAAPVGGLAWADEAQRLLVWDARPALTLLGRDGKRVARVPWDCPVRWAAVAADARAAFVIDAKDTVAGLAEDLRTLWRRPAAAKPTALACAALTGACAVADGQGGLTHIDSAGRDLARHKLPRPASHLLWPGDPPSVIAAADFGMLGRVNLVSGEWAWRQAPVSYVRSLTGGGASRPWVNFYSGPPASPEADGSPWSPAGPVPPSRCCVTDYRGGRVVGVDAEGRLFAKAVGGPPPEPWAADRPATFAAIDGFGRRAFLATDKPSVMLWETDTV